MSLMYAEMEEAASPATAREYKCWALSQVRYMLGDVGRSLMVGFGHNPPKRTQDRSAACPDPPAVSVPLKGGSACQLCSVGSRCALGQQLHSPWDPDSHVLAGALVYGSGRYDDFSDVRSDDSSRVGIENNAGMAAALAGVVQVRWIHVVPCAMWALAVPPGLLACRC